MQKPHIGAKPPTLSAEEREARERRLEAQHQEFIKSVATSRSVTMTQSSTAGAGGKTNQKVRVSEDHEAERLLRMRVAAEAAARDAEYQHHLTEKNMALAKLQEKKREKRNKKLAAKKQRAEGAKRHTGNSSSSSSSDSGDGDHTDPPELSAAATGKLSTGD